MRDFRAYLTELFDSPFTLVRVKEKKLFMGSIVTYFYKMDPALQHKDSRNDRKNSVTVNFQSFGDDPNGQTWEVDFIRGGAATLTGQGQAERVFATALDAIRRFVGEYNPEVLMFTAAKEEMRMSDLSKRKGSRISLYKAIIRRYAPRMGYEMISTDKQYVKGGEEHVFILKKVKP